jgi:Putative zinc-finger
VSSSGSGGQRSAPAEQHLGDRLAAFVDGELTDDSRDRVLAHLATCPQCKAAADEQRRLKSVIATCELPAISAGLLARLQGLPGMGNGTGPYGGNGNCTGHLAGEHDQDRGNDRTDDRTDPRSDSRRRGSGGDGPGGGPGVPSRSGARAGSGARRGPFESGLPGTGVFGQGRREFSYLTPGGDPTAPAGSRSRGFRVHELTRAAAAGPAGHSGTGGPPTATGRVPHRGTGGAGATAASRGRRFAVAAAGAFSMAAIAIGGALPMEVVGDGAARPDDGPAVSPFRGSTVSDPVSDAVPDTRGAVPRGLLGGTPAGGSPYPVPAGASGALSAASAGRGAASRPVSAGSVSSAARPLLRPGAVPVLTNPLPVVRDFPHGSAAGAGAATANSAFVLH